MKKLICACLSSLLLAAGTAAAEVSSKPPGEPYQKVSDLVELPEFVPGLGVLYGSAIGIM